MINPHKLERVAKAICRASGQEKHPCLWCENPRIVEHDRDGRCCKWELFTPEAEAAIKAVKGF